MTLQVLGLTIDQVDAAAVAAGALRVIGWPTTWRRRFEQLGLSFDGLVTHPVLIHGCLGVSEALRRELRAAGASAAWRFVEVLRKGPLPGGMDDPIPVECFRWELVHPGQPPIAIVPGCSAASVAQQAAERPAGGPRS